MPKVIAKYPSDSPDYTTVVLDQEYYGSVQSGEHVVHLRGQRVFDLVSPADPVSFPDEAPGPLPDGPLEPPLPQ